MIPGITASRRRSGAPPADPYWAYVVSLLHFDGADASTSIIDQKSKIWTAYASAQLDTAQARFGPSSLLVGGASTSRITTPSDADFAYGTNDFTIETWLRLTSVAASFQMIYDGRILANTVPRPTVYLSGSTLNYYANGASRISGGTVSTGAWHHIAISRVSGTTRMFLDGSQVGSSFADSINYEAHQVTIGNAGHTPYDAPIMGWLDDLRLTNGVGRYSSGFTPPPAPFPNS